MLSGVSVAISMVEFSGAETATFKIYNSEDDGTPKNEVYALTTPTLTAGATAFFAAPTAQRWFRRKLPCRLPGLRRCPS